MEKKSNTKPKKKVTKKTTNKTAKKTTKKVSKENLKRETLLTLIAVFSLIFLTAGVSYAYFSVTSVTNTSSNTKLNTTVAERGQVFLNGTNAALRLELSEANMVRGSKDTSYYATQTGVPSTSENNVLVGSTNTTSEGTYNCSYTLNVANTTSASAKSMYTTFRGMGSNMTTGQIILTVGGQSFDFYNVTSFPITVNGTLNGVTSSDVKSIYASFKIVNKENIDQSALASSSISLSITATAFSCDLV